jgi:hypothetical protein
VLQGHKRTFPERLGMKADLLDFEGVGADAKGEDPRPRRKTCKSVVHDAPLRGADATVSERSTSWNS